jgi:hypothetical protein
MPVKLDKELQEFRDVMQVPDTFEDGFSWTSVLGVVFVALLMVPGAIYMQLLAGMQSIGAAAQWVTVILFIEVARRAQRSLKRAEVYVLYYMAGAIMVMPFSGLIWRQFFINSDAAIAQGIAEHIPSWWAPAVNSSSYSLRSFLHIDWLIPVFLVVFIQLFSRFSQMVLGYGLFRLTSDIEKLPFPMAPVGAQGIMALAEEASLKKEKTEAERWRWRVFSIGGAIGLSFGTVYLLLPTLSGALTSKTVQLFQIPFSDFTQTTGKYLPAVATGMSWDLGNLIFGMVLPFFAMLGSFIGLVMTFVLNPVLYHFGILQSWQQGDETVATFYKNNVDFFFSFQIGLALAVAAFGIYQVVRSIYQRKKDIREGKIEVKDMAIVPKSRGDIRPWHIVGIYMFITLTYIIVSGFLINWHKGIMIVLVILGFVYTPLMSYVTARLEGLVGQVVEVPMIKEASLILSGYKGVACWFLPMPLANYGLMTVRYKECELTGTKFTSLWKAQIVLFPIILVSSIFFMNFIWGLNEVPSPVYPFAEKMWKLQAENVCIMYSSTLGEYSTFEQAFTAKYVGWGALFGMGLFSISSLLGAPMMMAYGLVRGLGQTIPHVIVPQFIGALIGRYYFKRKLGLKWRQYIPVVSAGYACGMGLITTIGVGITFLSKAAVPLSF